MSARRARSSAAGRRRPQAGPPAKPRGGRGRGQTSRAIAASSRANGAKGGRPRARLTTELIRDLGPQPDDPLKVAKWNRKMLGILEWGILNGEDWKEMSHHLNQIQKTKAQNLKLEITCDAILERIADDDVRDEDAAPASVSREEDSVASANAGALRRDPS